MVIRLHERGIRMVLSLREDIARVRNLDVDQGLLLQRAELLSEQDRAIIEAVLVRGQSAASLARLMNANPRVLRKRVRQIHRRMLSREFLAAARAIGYLAPGEAELAKLRYCQRLSYRQLCSRLAITSHALRRKLCALSARIQTISQMMARHQEHDYVAEV